MTLAVDRIAEASRWRRRPLAEKALLALGLLALTVALPPWPASALALAVAWVAALAGARVGLADWLRLVAAPMGFAVVGAAALAVEVADGLRLAADGGAAAFGVALRALAAVSCLLLLAVSTPAAELVAGLRRLGLPAEVAEVALLTWRFIFLLLEAASSIRAAQEARLGWHGRRRSLRSLGLLIAALLPVALDRARRLEVGLAARGFDGRLRMLSPVRPLSWPRLALVGATLVAVAGAGLWR